MGRVADTMKKPTRHELLPLCGEEVPFYTLACWSGQTLFLQSQNMPRSWCGEHIEQSGHRKEAVYEFISAQSGTAIQVSMCKLVN